MMAPPDVSVGNDFPVAPLFTTSSIVPDDARVEVEKIDIAGAESTLNALDKVVRSFERKGKLSISTTSKTPLLSKLLTIQGWFAACALMFVSLLIASMILLKQSRDSLDDCIGGREETRPPENWVFVDSLDDVSYNKTSTLTLDLTTVCHLTTGAYWKGAPQWRWLLFFALWPPLSVVGHGIAWGISTLVLNFEGSGWFLALTMHDPLGAAICCILWTVAWRLLMDDAIKWSHQADEWNDDAGATIWRDEFRTVHFYMLRALIAYFLFECASLLRQTLSSYVALRFHHKQFFRTMQRALVQEHSIQALSGPSANKLDRSIELPTGHRAPVAGMELAHWEAAKFLTRFADECGMVVNLGKHDASEARIAQLQARAKKVRGRLAATLATRINTMAQQADAAAKVTQNQEARKDHDAGKAGLVARSPKVPTVTKEDIERAAEISLGAKDIPGRMHSMSLEVVPDTPNDDESGDDEPEPPENALVELALEAAQAFKNLDGVNATRMASVASKWTPQEVAAQLASQTRETTTREWFLVNILREYFLQRPHMQVALYGDNKLKECVESAQFARQVGYLMFFNLKRNDAALTISEKEVSEAETATGLHKAHTWRLFNRDGDLSSTLQEFMEGTERMHKDREVLAQTLLGNVAVVRQVEGAIGALFLIVWVFIAAAIFDPDAVQRTWTALSAGLLSFSFIFSNTIRELFENAIYFFSVQPFDPSDAIVFDGVRYSVDHITLLSIELKRGDGAIVTVATSEMRTKQVHNITRSGKLQEELKFSVDRSTPHNKLKGVAHYVQRCIQAHPKLYNGTYVIFWSASTGDKLTLSVAYDHKTNGVDLLLTQIAKTFMYDAVTTALQDLDIRFTADPHLSGLGVDGGGGGGDGGGAGSSGPPEGVDVVRVAAGTAMLSQM
eukprot:jgi/Ulvmu1/8911/UM005_0002.1